MKKSLFSSIYLIILLSQLFTVNIAQAQFTFVQMYQSIWGLDRTPENNDFRNVTIITIFKIDPKEVPPYYGFDGINESEIPRLLAFKDTAHAHGVKVEMCLGGVGDPAWSANRMPIITADSTLCQTVVDALYQKWIVEYGFDGFNTDWESALTLDGNELWGRILSRKLHQNGKINSIAIGRGTGAPINSTEWIARYVAANNAYYDYIYVMPYDGNGPWSSRTGFHEPLYNPIPNYPPGAYPTEENGKAIDDQAESWFTAGLNRSKSALLLSTYGWYFPPATGATGPAQDFNHNASGVGIAPYRDIRSELESAGETGYDTLAQMAWLGSPSFGYIGYNSTRSMTAKVNYAQQKQYGGIGWFTYDGSHSNGYPVGQKAPLWYAWNDAITPASPSAPSFTAQPNNQTVYTGNTASFSVIASGYPLPTYQWQKNGVTIVGAISASYTTPVTVIGDNGATFRCIATNALGTATSANATLTISTPSVANPTSDDFSNIARFANLWTKSHPQLTNLIGLGTSDALLRLNLDGAAAHEMWNNDYSAVRALQDITDGNFEVVAKFQTLPSATYQWEGILVKEHATSFLRFDIIKDNGGLKFYAGKASATSEQKILTSVNIPGPSAWVKVGRAGNVWTAYYSADGSTFIQTGQFVQVIAVDSIGVYAGNQTSGSGVPAFDCKVDYFFNVGTPINPEDPVTGAPTGTFAVSSDTLPAGGGNVTLTWTSSGAVSASIDQGIGTVTLNGSIMIPVGQTKSFTLTLTNALGSQSYVAAVFVELPGGGGSLQDITSSGAPIALITNPTGTGNRNLEVIRDGITPPQGSTNPNEQYDTFNGGGTRLTDWIGYTYPTIQSFGSITLQEGIHATQGGFFTTAPRVEVRVGAQWIEVQGLTITPAYGAGTASNFATYIISFNAISGDGIRVVGIPGGTAQYLSVGELRVMGTPTSTVAPDTKPKNFDLLNNYPNPFNPSTTIEFTVSTLGYVTLEIYNILGQKVRTLVDQVMDQGKWPVTWDGRDENSRLVSSGVYLYKMQAGDFLATRKMVLSK